MEKKKEFHLTKLDKAVHLEEKVISAGTNPGLNT